MKRFRNYLSKIQDRPLAEAVGHVYHALFEGLTPQQKARRTIRAVLNQPPDGWDSPAKRTDGTEFVSEHGTTLTWDQVLETYLRGLIFRDKAIASKFEPGVARIAYGELGIWPEDIEDFRANKPESVPLGQFRSILHMLSGDAHVNEYDFDLNGLTYAELADRFGKASAEADSDDTEDTGVLNYKIVHIPDFDTAQEYAKYTNHWCVCEHRDYFNRYTARGKNTFYMLFAPGFEDMEDVHGENYPKDEYGLSVVGPMIAPDGSVEYCCVRRNHEGGMGDHALTEKELSQLLGRPVRTVLPHLENEAAMSITARVKAKMARGMQPSEIYGEVDGRPFENATVYRQKDGTRVLVDNSTKLPLVDYELDSWSSLDSRALYAEVAVGTNQYDDDVFVTFLIRHDGNMYAIGSSDYEGRDAHDCMYNDAVSDISTTGIAGLYHVTLDDDYRGIHTLIYLPEHSGPYGVTDMHEDIEVYAADGLIVCDPGSETISSGEGDLEIIKWYPDVNHKELLGSSTLGSAPRHVIVCDHGMPEGKVNILYDDDDDELHIIQDGEDKYIGIDSDNYDLIDDRMYPGLIWVENSGEDEYVVYSVREGKLVADGLASQPDDYGIYEDENGKKNMVTDRGVLLEQPADNITVVGRLKAPIHSKLQRVDSRGLVRQEYFVDVTREDGEHFVDIDTGKELYGHPIPRNAYPYTENLYIGPFVEDGRQRQALYSMDGRRTSGAFDTVSATYEIVNRTDEKGLITGYNVINPVTGKEVFPYWLPDLPRALTGSDTMDGLDVGLFVCNREDKKKTLMRIVTPVNSDGAKVDYSRFYLTDVGWHDHIEQIPGCPLCVLLHDSSTGEYPVSTDKYLTAAYDLRTGKHTGWYPGMRLIAAFRRMAQEYAGNNTGANKWGMALANCPDWTEWIDSHIDTAENRMEA